MNRVVCASTVAACLLAVGCGGSPESPTSPSPPPVTTPPITVPGLAGVWTGEMVVTAKGRAERGALGTRLELVQNNRDISGTWVVTSPADNDIKGDLTGTLEGNGSDAQFRGVATWKTPSAVPAIICTGRVVLNGPAALILPLRWTAPAWESDAQCSDPGITDVVWSMRRQ